MAIMGDMTEFYSLWTRRPADSEINVLRVTAGAHSAWYWYIKYRHT